MGRAYEGESEIDVAAARERVYEILEDSTLLPRWAPMVKETSGRRETPGSVRHCRIEFDGRTDQVRERCIEAVRGERISWVMEEGMMTRMFSRVEFGFTLDNAGGEATRLRLRFLYRPRSVLVRILYTLLMKKKMARLRGVLLRNLKAMAEGRNGA